MEQQLQQHPSRAVLHTSYLYHISMPVRSSRERSSFLEKARACDPWRWQNRARSLACIIFIIRLFLPRLLLAFNQFPRRHLSIPFPLYSTVRQSARVLDRALSLLMRTSALTPARSVGAALCLFLSLFPTETTAAPQASSTSSGSGAANSTAPRPLGTRAHHGLQADWMQVNSIYIGFLPDWSRENPIDINVRLGKSMAIIGDYVDIREDDLSLSQVRYHNDAIVRLRDYSVYAPAIRPRMRLSQWTDDMSTAVARMAQNMNQQGVKVWLRFAWEMNGDWMEYGNQPDDYRRVFQSVSVAVKQATNETWMLWAPNVRYGETESLAGYSAYYPGRDCEFWLLSSAVANLRLTPEHPDRCFCRCRHCRTVLVPTWRRGPGSKRGCLHVCPQLIQPSVRAGPPHHHR